LTLEDNKLFRLIAEERDRKHAKNLLELGISVDIIKKAIGLSDHEIDEIQKELVPANG
jgi:riboflavin synthase